MEKIEIGKIVNAHGIKGEVKVYTYSEPYRYGEIGSLIIDDKRYDIEKVRFADPAVVLKLKGIDDRNAAEAVKEKSLWITEDQLPELPDGEYYIRDLIGMDVVSEDGEKYGVLNDVLTNTAQQIYEVKRENAPELLIPGVKQFILNVNKEEKKITVRLPEGLLDI